MHKRWNDLSWDDYLYWQYQDKKTLKRINSLLKDIERNGESVGIGEPERLKYQYSKYWSRRIDEKNRLIYCVENDEIQIISCKNHCADK